MPESELLCDTLILCNILADSLVLAACGMTETRLLEAIESQLPEIVRASCKMGPSSLIKRLASVAEQAIGEALKMLEARAGDALRVSRRIDVGITFRVLLTALHPRYGGISASAEFYSGLGARHARLFGVDVVRLIPGAYEYIRVPPEAGLDTLCALAKIGETRVTVLLGISLSAGVRDENGSTVAMLGVSITRGLETSIRFMATGNGIRWYSVDCRAREPVADKVVFRVNGIPFSCAARLGPAR